jgi:hypothetical protein
MTNERSWNTDHGVTRAHQAAVAGRVCRLASLMVGVAIDFDDKRAGASDEVDDGVTDDGLALERDPKLRARKDPPEAGLRRSGVETMVTRASVQESPPSRTIGMRGKRGDTLHNWTFPPTTVAGFGLSPRSICDQRGKRLQVVSLGRAGAEGARSDEARRGRGWSSASCAISFLLLFVGPKGKR